MISARAMGLIFPNLHDQNLPELVGHRTTASIPIAGRYRMIDFCLSGMTVAGIQNIGVLARRNYQSLMDHLGTGREWDLSSKRGGLVLFPPYARGGVELFSGRIEALASILDYIESRREELVVLSDCDIAFNLDYKELLAAHLSTGADITVLYERGVLQSGQEKDNVSLTMDENGRVTAIRMNEYKSGEHHLSMNVFVVGRRQLVEVVRECTVRGEKDFIGGYLARNLSKLSVCGHPFTGYRARIYNMQSYYHENLRLLNSDNLLALFPKERPVYTKVRDEAPVRYAIGCQVDNSLLADGCIIEGTVQNCVLFRGVRVGRGAVLKNCVIMQNSGVGEDAVLENVVTDKDVRIGAGQQLRGAASFPVFIAKGCSVV